MSQYILNFNEMATCLEKKLHITIELSLKTILRNKDSSEKSTNKPPGQEQFTNNNLQHSRIS